MCTNLGHQMKISVTLAHSLEEGKREMKTITYAYEVENIMYEVMHN